MATQTHSAKRQEGADRTAPKAATAKRQRACLRCRAPFMSEGAHNRMCDPCRKLSAALDASTHTIQRTSGRRG